MKKIVLIDGNNLMFRSYYATAYSGKVMTNSKGFPTNALYGFANMINKIIEEEKPVYMAVAFDVGKNFRKQEYDFYKEGRNKTPDELKMQMPIAREILSAMGIKYLELEPYEADDIIGTLVKKIAQDADFDATIVSSDKDLLQLINFETDIKLLKQTGYIRYNEETFKEAYEIDPIRIIDLKGLMGDSSDNIPGVKGIGEKTALKLLSQYGSLEGIYEHIDDIKGSVHDKLVSDKDNAFMSKKIATIYRDVPLDIKLDDLKYDGPDASKLNKIYSDLEFTSLQKKINVARKDDNIKIVEVNDNINVVLEDKVALYIELDNDNYTVGNIIGASVCDSKNCFYFDNEHIDRLISSLEGKNIITYDCKKNYYLFDNLKANDDVMISSYLLGYNTKDSITSLAALLDYNLTDINKNSTDEEVREIICKKAKFIYDINDELVRRLKDDKSYDVYQNIELPLTIVLSKMEKAGIKVDKDILLEQGKEIEDRIITLTSEIYEDAGCEFNIASPKQLGEILFEKLEIAKGKKNKTGYKTDVDTLQKYADRHPIINKILDYRALAKLKSTYIDGLIDTIEEDNKIHTIFKQTVARTGRLSSIDPNLQNIPAHDEYGRCIRKAFIPENDVFLSLDYSQIELRIFAHMSNCKTMIDTFENNGDIHAKVASDINGVDISEVTKEMRSKAKAVIFGIIYGISGFGLGDNLHISTKEASAFIEKYYELYPEVKQFMNMQINKAKEDGFVTTLFGRKRVIEELSSTNFMIRQSGERMAINTPIQGTAADIIKIAMIRVNDAFTKEGIQSKLLLQVHDELIFDVKNDELDKVVSIVKNIMENVIELSAKLKVSNDTGVNWYETK